MDLLTSREAAEYLKISQRSLVNLRNSGVGPTFSCVLSAGRGIRYRRDELDRWIAGRAAA